MGIGRAGSKRSGRKARAVGKAADRRGGVTSSDTSVREVRTVCKKREKTSAIMGLKEETLREESPP